VGDKGREPLCLSEREKRCLADATKAEMTEEELDAAVHSGVLQSLNQWIKQRSKT
jgi:hypothetical protein